MAVISEYEANELKKYKTLFIIRGPSTTGKSVIANYLTEYSCSANDFFIDGKGVYCFDQTKSREAHDWCLSTIEKYMSIINADIIAVHNTFSSTWEYQEYIDLAKYYGYAINVIECKTQFENDIHDVPQDVVTRIIERWQSITKALF